MAKTIGIKVQVQDESKEALASVGNNAAKSGTTMQAAFEKSIIRTQALFQAFRIGMRVAREFAQGIEACAAAALAHRAANDQTVMSIDAWAKASDRAASSLGDAFLPAVNMLAIAGTNLADQFSEWEKQNNSLITGRMIEWAGDLANVMVSGIAAAVAVASKSFTGLQMTWLAFKAATAFTAEDTQSYLRQIDKIDKAQQALEASVDKASAAIAEQIGNASRSAQANVGKEHHGTHGEAARAIADAMLAEREKNNEINAINEKNYQENLQKLKEETDAENTAIAIKKLDAAQSIADQLQAIEEENLNRQVQLSEAAYAKSKEYADITKNAWIGAAQSMAASFGATFAAIATGQQDVAAAMASLGLDIIQTVMNTCMQVAIAHAVAAAAGAAESQAWVPGIGPILALAAMGALFGGIISFAKSKLTEQKAPGRASGGPVSAGSTYMVGERGPELFRPGSNGSIIPNNALGAGGSTLVANVGMMGPMSKADGTRFVLDVIDPIFTKLARQGRLQCLKA
jgi:hypothetical protein